jgi:hypothetical protein
MSLKSGFHKTLESRSARAATLRVSMIGLAFLLLALTGCSSNKENSNKQNTKADEDSGVEADSGGTSGTTTNPPNSCNGTTLIDCDSDKQVENACKTFNEPVIGPAVIQMGPYGGRMLANVGGDFPVELNARDNDADCQTFVATFTGVAKEATDNLLNLRGLDLTQHTLFGPACPKEGEKYPVITWGNGTCAQPGGYSSMLQYLASYGYIIVAANSRYTRNGAMLTALDFAFAANDRKTLTQKDQEGKDQEISNPWYQKMDLDHIGAMGHSQGGGATVEAAANERIRAVFIWNDGNAVAVKPFIASSGDKDILGGNLTGMQDAVNGTSVPGAYFFYHNIAAETGALGGHLTLMMEPERTTELTRAWWDFQFKSDTIPEAKDYFVGDDCTYCKGSSPTGDYEYGHNAALK